MSIFTNQPRLPETLEDLAPNTHNPDYIIALNKRFNEQSDRLAVMFAGAYEPSYADILPWRERQKHFKAQSGGISTTTGPRGCEVVDLDIDGDEEEDEQGYQDFLATEFDS